MPILCYYKNRFDKIDVQVLLKRQVKLIDKTEDLTNSKLPKSNFLKLDPMRGQQIKFVIWEIRGFDKIGVDKIENLL